MKVPPPPGAGVDRAPTYDKDRTLTRRTVAGAGGGLKGVDYEDDRRPEAHEEAARRGARPGPHEPTPGAALASAGSLGASGTDKDALGVVGAERRADEDEVKPRAPERRKAKFQFKDDLTIDKDGPDRRPKRRSEKESSEDEDESSSEAIEWTDGVESGGPPVSRAHLFQETPEGPEPGDPRLFDPIAAREQLGTPLAFAKHVMILGEALRRSTGATRAEAVDYLGRMFVASGDVNFGRNALKSFGPASGILDVYPLEVVEHVLEHYPGFLPKIAFGRFFSKDGAPLRPIEARAGERVVLEYADELKVRGFALRGGGRPGYTFEPGERAGSYHLTFASGGRFSCLVSAVSRTGHTVVERIEVLVHGPRAADPSPYPARDAARVAAWPKPPRPKLAPAAAAEATPAARATGAATLDKGALFALKGRELEKSVRGRASARVAVDEIDESDAPIAARVEPHAPRDDGDSVARVESVREEREAPVASAPISGHGQRGDASTVGPSQATRSEQTRAEAVAVEEETQPRVRALGAASPAGAAGSASTGAQTSSGAPTPSGAPTSSGAPTASARPGTARGEHADRASASLVATGGARASASPATSAPTRGAATQPTPSGARASVPPPAMNAVARAPAPRAASSPRARPSAPPPAPVGAVREQSGSILRAELSPALRDALAAAPIVERPRGFADTAPDAPLPKPEAPRTHATAKAPGASTTEAPEPIEALDATPLAPAIDTPARRGIEVSSELTRPETPETSGPARPPFAALIADMSVGDTPLDEGDEPTLVPDGDVVELPSFVREVRPTRPLFDDDDDDDDDAPRAPATPLEEQPRPRRIRSDSTVDEP